MRGAVADPGELKFKDGRPRSGCWLACETTDRICLFATNGRAYTLKAGDLPRGRGDGQPVRVLVEMTNEDDVAAMFLPSEGTRWLVASSSGRGFVVKAEELLAEKRTGRQVLNLRPGEEAQVCVLADGDHVAAIGNTHRLLVFPLEQVPELARGAGVILQKYSAQGRAERPQGVPPGGRAELAHRANAPAPKPTCANGSASAPRSAAARRTGFRKSGKFG